MAEETREDRSKSVRRSSVEGWTEAPQAAGEAHGKEKECDPICKQE